MNPESVRAVDATGSRLRLVLLSCLVVAPVLAAAQGLVYATRDHGRCTLRGRTTFFPPGLAQQPMALSALCRYRPDSEQWTPVDLPPARSRTVRPDSNPPAARSTQTDALLFDLTALASLGEEPALLAVEWTEDGVRASAVLACGGILCEDLDRGPIPPGRVAACLPGRTSAQSRLVIDPELACFARFDVAGAPRRRTAATAHQALELLIAAFKAKDVRSVQELTTREGLLSLDAAHFGDAAAAVQWPSWGRSWARAPRHWLSASEVLIGPEMKSARAVFVQDARGWRLQAWYPGL